MEISAKAFSANGAVEGICSTCGNSEGCDLKNDKGLPVWECELFFSRGSAKQGRVVTLGPEKKEESGLKGICGNCAVGEVCTLRNDGEVKSYCNEHR